MNKKTIKDIKLKDRTVVMRVDFNVPIKGGVIADDTRIQAALPSIRYAIEKGAALVLMSHLGRPDGKIDPVFSLRPVADALSQALGKQVAFANDCQNATEQVEALKPGDVLMLENTRFYLAEEGKVKQKDGQSKEEYAKIKADLKIAKQAMAEKLASYGDVYVNDAFGTAHRDHASTASICKYMKAKGGACVAGLLMQKELEYLGSAVENPIRPFVAILGGAKVSDKLGVVKNLLTKVDTLIIGGGMAYTFLKAQGYEIGKSICELDQLDYARDMIAQAKERGVNLLLPEDNVAADAFDANANTRVVENNIPEGWMALDIGPETTQRFSEAAKNAKTLVWNGPMGCFEMPAFAKGTFGVCEAVAEVKANGGISIIGGGDSVNAVMKSGLAEHMSHISTGGGASLEFLEGKTLPGCAALDDK